MIGAFKAMSQIGSQSVLVLLSFVLAVLASYTVLHIAARVGVRRDGVGSSWFWAGAGIAGLGLWATHFIGMLAFGLPLPRGYANLITLISLLFAIAFSALAIWLMARPGLALWERGLGAIMVGAGLTIMPYIGMEAVRPSAAADLVWALVVLSFTAGIGTAGLFIYCGDRLRELPATVPSFWQALLLGLGLSIMYYSGTVSTMPPSLRPEALTVSGEALTLALVVLTAALSLGAIRLSASYAKSMAQTTALKLSLREAQEQLSYLSAYDSVTGVPKRHIFDEQLATTIAQGRAEGRKLALLVIDVDAFRAVNEAFGHQVGDEVLKQTAQRLQSVCGPHDQLARLGGDVFVVAAVLPPSLNATAVAASYLACLREPLYAGGQELRLSASMGIALYPQDGLDPPTLIAKAEAAKAHAKQLGRERSACFTPRMNMASDRPVRVLEQLRSAIDKDELRLFYQAKIDAATGKRVGVEALLRWQNKALGYVAPDEFIPVADQNHMILPLQVWMLDEVCRQLADWDKVDAAIPTVAINIPEVQFQQPHLADSLAIVLKRHNLQANRLILEVAETTAMKHAAQSVKIMERLHAMGIGLSIGDFGTGYSSLPYLRRFPASELKIDRSLIHGLGTASGETSVVTAILAMARALRLTVVAEGVETEAQRQKLTELGCDVLQGYLVGRPAPAWTFEPQVARLAS
ncbi:bifunctional diguanylate cyclase/phosphodiesterase [Bordetella avium]|nr:bifunctional diguanylate cyclase/phosphodiesterase [Bordetella avium]